MKRLSAWTRIWLAFSLALWSYGAWWVFNNVGLPPTTVSANDACSYVLGTAPNDHAEYVRRCLSDPVLETEARVRYLRNARDIFLILTVPWVIAPFLVAIVFIVVKSIVLVIRKL